MKYNFRKMNESYADEIAYKWKYKGKYSFYNMTDDPEDLEEFINPNNWENKFTVINEHDELIGFYSYYFQDEVMWVGFGLRPDLTGKGLGASFVKAGIEYGLYNFSYSKDHIMLAVAKFNKRAIKLYKKIGFETTKEYDQKTNGGIYRLVAMKKRLNFY